MKVKRSGNNVNIYDGERLLLHLDKNENIFTAVNDSVRISAKIEKMSDTATKFSDVSLKKMNSAGKMVKNTSQKWMRHYTAWLESVCREYGLL